MRAAANLRQQCLAEFTGSAMLLCAVIGSGIMAERLAGGNLAIALLANTLATVFALFVLITLLGPVSGAHINPLVTCVIFFKQKSSASPGLPAQAAMLLIAMQLLGAAAGAFLAHAMFDLPLLQTSSHVRGGWDAVTGTFTGPGQWIAEAVATAGLILLVLRAQPAQAPALVACYIGAAYWFCASTSFANPAAVVGRMLTDTFSGIAPVSAAGFVLSQMAGAGAGVLLDRWLGPTTAAG